MGSTVVVVNSRRPQRFYATTPISWCIGRVDYLETLRPGDRVPVGLVLQKLLADGRGCARAKSAYAGRGKSFLLDYQLDQGAAA